MLGIDIYGRMYYKRRNQFENGQKSPEKLAKNDISKLRSVIHEISNTFL